MNERIRELAEQAGYDIGPFYTGEDNYQIPHYKDEKLEKFAELIVRECLSIAHQEHKNALEFEWDNDDTAQTIRDSISEHFGVEE